MRWKCLPTHHKVHLLLVIVGEEEDSGDCVIGYLVVKGLAMELEEGGVWFDCVATPA